MVDTYTPSNRLTKQEIGANANTWGNVLNDGVIALVDNSLDGQLSLDVTLGDITLTTNNGAVDQARNRLLDITSAATANRVVILPDVPKLYFVKFTKTNTGNVTIRNLADGTGVTLTEDFEGTLRCDGSTTVEFNPFIPTPLTTILAAVYPVGSIYVNAANSTNPATLFGFGTWVAFGAGRVMVGLDAGDPAFDLLEETGGAKTHTLTVPEMPAHSHDYQRSTTSSGTAFTGGSLSPSEQLTATSTVGGGLPHNNLQPYIVVQAWKRTA